MKYKHSERYYREKYSEIVKFAKEKGINNPYKNLNEFRMDYNDIKDSGSKNVMYEMKYNLQYDTSIKTARQELGILKELGLEKGVKLKDLKKMSTQDFAAKYQEQIEDEYWQLRNSGVSASKAKFLISTYWFGSV